MTNDTKAVAHYSGRGDHIQIGTVRKGDQKGTGQGGRGADLQNKLRINFDGGNENVREYCSAFERFYERTGRNIYELRPTEYAVTDVPFIIPLSDFRAFDFAYTVNISYPIGRSDVRGEYWEWLREPGSMNMLVYGGKVAVQHSDIQGNVWNPGDVRTIDPTLPVFNYRGNDLTVKANMSLKMLLPHLRTARYVKLVSTSVNDARHIYNQLIWIRTMADNARVHWNRIPLTVSRREREITKNYGSQPQRENDWMLSLDIADPEVETYLAYETGGGYFFPEQE